MYPHFLALFNKSGIACAADADHTVLRLSNNLPVAVAINPASSIPWEKILHDYQRVGRLYERTSIAEYVFDFSSYLASVSVKKGWENLPSEELNIIFMGFGSGDIFPSVYDVCAEVESNTLLLSGDICEKTVGADGPVLCHLLGDFDNVATLIWGASEKVRSFFFEKNLDLYLLYKKRIKEKYQGTEYEDYVSRQLDAYEADTRIIDGLDRATNQTYSSFIMGVDSFSVEDMVTAVESLVKANSELSHLSSGSAGNASDVKEIAVLTIPEGLTWVKHSIYYRRSEI